MISKRKRGGAILLCAFVVSAQLGIPVLPAARATYQHSSVATRRTSSSFKYDAYGRRTQKTISGASTSYLYDGANPVQELSGTTPTANLLTGFGADQYLRRTDSSGSRDLLSDGLGSTVALTDAMGAVQTSYSYEPFGNTTSSGAASGNSYQYTGRENDGTGLYYYRARYYSPGFQRFVSEDPAGFGGGSVDLYAYAADSPVNLTDPSGEFLPLMAAGCLSGATGAALLDDVRMAMGVVKNGDPGIGAGQFASDILVGCVTGAIFGPIFGKVAGPIIGKVLGTVGGPTLAAEAEGAWFEITNATAKRPGTLIPHSFDLSVAGENFSVVPNATKHLAEYATGTAAATMPMSPMAGSVETAIGQGMLGPGRNFITIGNWELGIDRATNVIYHAVFRP